MIDSEMLYIYILQWIQRIALLTFRLTILKKPAERSLYTLYIVMEKNIVIFFNNIHGKINKL